MIAVYRRELRRYFSNMVGFAFVGILLLVIGILTYLCCFYANLSNFQGVLYYSSLSFALLIPIMTMNSMAEERHQKTDQLLYALPLRSSGVVMGKYFAMVTVLAIPTLVTAIYPLILSAFGSLQLAVIYVTLLNFFLMGCALIAICMFLSSLTESTLIAALLSIGAMAVVYLTSLLVALVPNTAAASYLCFTVVILLLALMLWYMTRNITVPGIALIAAEAALTLLFLLSPASLAAAFPRMIRALSLFDRLSTAAYGSLLDLTTPFYYLSIAFLFCFFTVQSMEKRRWS